MENLRVLLRVSQIQFTQDETGARIYLGVLWCALMVFMLGCSKGVAHNEAISLGSVTALQTTPTPLAKKPHREIARICASHSTLNSHKSYQILTLDNLLKEAQRKTGQTHFEQVGIWQQSWHMIVWQKKCLILGE